MNRDAWIRAESRGYYTLPDLINLDLRAEKEFKIGDNILIRIFSDIFNVFNTNSATGVVDVSSSASQTFLEMTNIYPPRVFRIGSKISFNFR
jgi:hypothetical protein